MNWEERRLIVRVAKLYFIEGFTQAQIAKKINVSRPVISKLLQKAKENGIVEIFIKDDTVQTIDLERKMEQAFRLREAIVVPTGELPPEMAKQSVGQAAAYFVSKNMKDTDRIGISWGTSVHYFVKEYPYERRPEVKVIPLIGGMGRKRGEIHSNQLAYELAKKLGGQCEFLYAPAIVESEEFKKRLIEATDVDAVLAEGAKVDMAVVGIGSPFLDSTMVEIGYLNDEDLHLLKEAKIVGDSNSRFFDAEGNPLDFSLNRRVVGVDIQELKKVETVIGITSGKHKKDSIVAALKGSFIDVLITDDQTAQAIVKSA